MADQEPDFSPDFSHGPALRTIAMPADANPNGDIFGGWLLAQMDVAGGMVAARRAGGRVATVGIEAMKFHQPVLIGDEVSCYCTVQRIGRTSMAVKVDTWIRRGQGRIATKVTEGVFTYVAIGEDRRPRPVPPGEGGT
ncbi:acyl-CoA thioesterase [Skermanella sp. TT6]|uniref:Acyl-CoA thioesterase n=1 Tax=Skermanella cutis TaxID=2775420 RepID=A0ABX7B7J9_9PROT|nr:acyl-CoA thioesterase [Skermanella sp. TT6]QQP88441.1 acyl-CoA thioesterase [Skermanella sp. TT6]